MMVVMATMTMMVTDFEGGSFFPKKQSVVNKFPIAMRTVASRIS